MGLNFNAQSYRIDTPSVYQYAASHPVWLCTHLPMLAPSMLSVFWRPRTDSEHHCVESLKGAPTRYEDLVAKTYWPFESDGGPCFKRQRCRA